jgi:hypothetical protein
MTETFKHCAANARSEVPRRGADSGRNNANFFSVNQISAHENMESQLNAGERAFITKGILDAPVKTRMALEVGA